MKTIMTITMNPTIDKSSRVQNVVAEKKLSCTPPVLNREAAGSMYPGPSKNWAGNQCFFTLQEG